VLAFSLVTAGALAKAGSMPFHTWIPAAADTAPAAVMAFIPSALDKLLGIYLLTRLTVGMFDVAHHAAVRETLMALGSVTVLAAVTMALVQKRMMRLLSFHAVSQVGYMVLGIASGTPVGIAGGLFHMVNNVMYKSGLFLAAGSVEHWSRDDDLGKLGGLAGQMPITFTSTLVLSLAIAGVPPLNGFASKWMIYQGVIDVVHAGNWRAVIYLCCAMLGSVLTLASFLKLLHAVFLGQRPAALARVREVPTAMWLPTALLALGCVGFGVFARELPLNRLILPSLGFHGQNIAGIWQPLPATLLLLVALGLGALIYVLGSATKPVAARTFVGGERIADEEESRFPGTAFYSPVKQLPIVGELLDFGGRGAFDLYNWVCGVLRGLGVVFRAWIDRALEALAESAGSLVTFCGRALSRLQNGNLPLYVGWIFAGAVVFYLVLLLR
jgi:formate hydrogenlyase subunit 3/multisubunit Na+/H+ antiporter MnhD subunit